MVPTDATLISNAVAALQRDLRDALARGKGSGVHRLLDQLSMVSVCATVMPITMEIGIWSAAIESDLVPTARRVVLDALVESEAANWFADGADSSTPPDEVLAADLAAIRRMRRHYLQTRATTPLRDAVEVVERTAARLHGSQQSSGPADYSKAAWALRDALRTGLDATAFGIFAAEVRERIRAALLDAGYPETQWLSMHAWTFSGGDGTSLSSKIV